MKIFQFAAMFLWLMVSVPDGHAHLAERYCVPFADARPAAFDTDFARLSRSLETGNCDIAARAVRIELHL